MKQKIEELSPLEDPSNWGKVELILSREVDATLDEMIELLTLSFRHDLWQRLVKPEYNTDPFRDTAYRLLYFTDTFSNFLGKHQVRLSTDELRELWGMLKQGHIQARDMSSHDIAKSLLDVLPSSVDKLVADEINNTLAAILFIRETVHGQQLPARIELGISKSLSTQYGSLLETLLYSLPPVSSQLVPGSNVKLEVLIQSYEKAESNKFLFPKLFMYYQFLRNTIHVYNQIGKNSDIAINTDVVAPLLPMLINVFRYLYDDTKVEIHQDKLVLKRFS